LQDRLLDRLQLPESERASLAAEENEIAELRLKLDDADGRYSDLAADNLDLKQEVRDLQLEMEGKSSRIISFQSPEFLLDDILLYSTIIQYSFIEACNRPSSLYDDDGCGLLPPVFWKFLPFVSLQSASERFRFLVPPSGTTCLSTSHLRRHSRFSGNDSRPFCFPVPTKTLSHDSCVTITIHHCCLDTCGPGNN